MPFKLLIIGISNPIPRPCKTNSINDVPANPGPWVTAIASKLFNSTSASIRVCLTTLFNNFSCP